MQKEVSRLYQREAENRLCLMSIGEKQRIVKISWKIHGKAMKIRRWLRKHAEDTLMVAENTMMKTKAK